jgi:hypothetical protein
LADSLVQQSIVAVGIDGRDVIGSNSTSLSVPKAVRTNYDVTALKQLEAVVEIFIASQAGRF